MSTCSSQAPRNEQEEGRQQAEHQRGPEKLGHAKHAHLGDGRLEHCQQQAAAGNDLKVSAVEDPKTDSNAVSLKYLGAKPASFDVLAHADWNASFDIGSVAADGKGPGTLVIDVAAAPSAAHRNPIRKRPANP